MKMAATMATPMIGEIDPEADPPPPPPHVHDRSSLDGALVLSRKVSLQCRSNPRSEEEGGSQLSVLTLILTALKRSGLSCNKDAKQEEIKMEISWPDNVRHVVHVTFDRFKGFLGLPVEFELEIPRRVPSASASVFGVSAESMQCSYDQRGNSVPVILLLMQERLYEQEGLMAEGIFRINPENGQEEHVRDQLNKGIVPQDIDVHCLAGLIKAWFRELPTGVLDSLSPEEVMECHTEEQSVKLVKLLPPTQFALLDWAINLMADVVQQEELNKMNARNIAMVFAPNMTQMSDPLTALMHAVQVMNLLKHLILKALRDREGVVLDPTPSSPPCQESDGDGHEGEGDGAPLSNNEVNNEDDEEEEAVEEVEEVVEEGGGALFYPEAEGSTFLQYIEEALLGSYNEEEEEEEDDVLSYETRGGLFSNGSSPLDNTDDDYSNCLEVPGKQGQRVVTEEGALALVENVKFISQENELLEYVQVQYSLFDHPSPGKGHPWGDGNQIADEIDQSREIGRSLMNA